MPGKNSVFTNGCLKFIKDALKKHVATVDHRVALAAKSGRKDMQRAISTVYRNREHAVRAALRTVYFIG